MGLKARPPNLIQFYSVTPNLDIISIQICTLNVTLYPTTGAIFRISNVTISSKSIQQKPEKRQNSLHIHAPSTYTMHGTF